MQNYKYLFGPVPSRRLGNSLGISPIPERTCSYSCIYCQLGRTKHMTSARQEFFPAEAILEEFSHYQKNENVFDIVTIVGEGEPTLYSKLDFLIAELKKRTQKPIAVITNGSLLSDPAVREQLMEADMVLPSMDACSEAVFRKINRPHVSVKFEETRKGLIEFSKAYKGKLWVEIMLVKGINDDDKSLEEFKEQLKEIRYDRVYINTPVRPPAEAEVQCPDKERIHKAVQMLSGISIDMLASGNFFSDIDDPYEAVLSICKRHPMNNFELETFLKSRQVQNIEEFVRKLQADPKINVIDYKEILTYRLK